ERRVGGVVVDSGVDECRAHVHEVGGFGDDLELLARFLDLFGTGVHGRQQDGLFVGLLSADDDDALAVEVVGHRARVGHRPAVAGNGHAHFGGRAVAGVGGAFDEQRHTAGGVAFVHYRLVGDTRAVEASAPRDRATDVVGRDGVLL